MTPRRARQLPLDPARRRTPRRSVWTASAAACALVAGLAVLPAVAADNLRAPTTSDAAAATTTIPSTTRPVPPTGVTAVPTKAVAMAPLAVPANVTKPAKRLRQMGTLMFPMQAAPKCAILDNFSDARSGGRSHEGVDILATQGQEVYAVDDGVLKRQYVAGGTNSSLSGNAWQLNTADGSYYFYAHLSSFAPGLAVGSSVSKGDVIGYVGDTGNPGPGNYHLHFEVHPNGGSAVDALTMLEIPAGCTVT